MPPLCHRVQQYNPNPNPTDPKTNPKPNPIDPTNPTIVTLITLKRSAENFYPKIFQLLYILRVCKFRLASFLSVCVHSVPRLQVLRDDGVVEGQRQAGTVGGAVQRPVSVDPVHGAQ